MVRAALPLLLLACAASAISFPATTTNEVSRTLERIRDLQKFTTMEEEPSEACSIAYASSINPLSMAFIMSECGSVFEDENQTMTAICGCQQEIKTFSDGVEAAIPSLREACGRCDEDLINVTSALLTMHDMARFLCQTNEDDQLCAEFFDTLSEAPSCETMDEVLGCCTGVAYALADCDEEFMMPDCPQVNKEVCSVSMDACPGEGTPSIFADCEDSAAHSSSSNVVLALSLIVAVMIGFNNV